MNVPVAGRASKPGARSALVLAVWIAWIAWLSTWYFTRPGEWVVLVEREFQEVPYWLDALGRAARALAAAGAVLLAAWGVGSTTLRRAAPLFDRPGEAAQFGIMAGIAVLSHGLLALAWGGAYRPLPAVLLVAAAACWGVVRLARAVSFDRRRRCSWPNGLLSLSFAGVALAALTFACIAALAPETEHDALWYHLWLPRTWMETGGMVDLVSEYVSLYPLGWDLLNGPAMVIGGSPGAKLLHFACLPLIAHSTFMLSRLLFPRANGAAAIAIAVTPPLVIWEGSTAYVDLALTWAVLLGGYGLLRHLESRRTGWLLLSSFAFGYALTIKHLALVALAIAGIALLIGELRTTPRVRRAVRTALLFGLLALAWPMPWYVRAYVASGNPVFPDMYSVFGASPPERWDDLSERALARFKSRFGRERNAANLFGLPWDVTVHGSRYGGTPGPVFLALVPVALLAGGRRARLVLLACGAYVLIWASPLSSFQLRFLVPLAPWLAVVCAEGLRVLPRGAGWVTAALVVLNLPPFIEWHERDRSGWSGWLTHVIRGLPLGVVLGAESEPQYLARAVPSYAAWRYIDSTLPAGSRVLTFSGGDHLHSATDRVWSDATLARGATWGTLQGDERKARAELARLGVTHVLFDKRLLDSPPDAAPAIATPAMRSCCLSPLYEDSRFALFRVR